MAQVIEEVSVLAADRRRKEPRVVTRPEAKADREETREEQVDRITARSNTGGTHLNHQQMLQLVAAKRGLVYVPPGEST